MNFGKTAFYERPASFGALFTKGELLMVQEFKDFISQGNIIAVAVGLVLAAAFGLVVQSFVDNILMQVIAMIFGEPDFGNLDFTINDARFRYGAFINSIVNFLAVGAGLYMFLKLLGKIPLEEEED